MGTTNDGENLRSRQHLKELIAAIAAYAVVLVISIVLVQTEPAQAIKVLLALAPMIPALFVPRAVIRELRRIDEMQRMIQLEALGISFCGTALLTFGYAFLESWAGFPQMSLFVVWPLMGALWIVGQLISRRKYA